MEIIDFLRESNAIEGIRRAPTEEEVDALTAFLELPALSFGEVNKLQAVFAPGAPFRREIGMDVRVGTHIAPQGGRQIYAAMIDLLSKANYGEHPWHVHCEFETLHPYMDGNGRTGRAIWLWQMRKQCGDDSLMFLHRFYYQTLEMSRR